MKTYYTLLVYPNRFGACRPIEELETTSDDLDEIKRTIELIKADHPTYDFYIHEEKGE